MAIRAAGCFSAEMISFLVTYISRLLSQLTSVKGRAGVPVYRVGVPRGSGCETREPPAHDKFSNTNWFESHFSP